MAEHSKRQRTQGLPVTKVPQGMPVNFWTLSSSHPHGVPDNLQVLPWTARSEILSGHFPAGDQARLELPLSTRSKCYVVFTLKSPFFPGPSRSDRTRRPTSSPKEIWIHTLVLGPLGLYNHGSVSQDSRRSNQPAAYEMLYLSHPGGQARESILARPLS